VTRLVVVLLLTSHFTLLTSQERPSPGRLETLTSVSSLAPSVVGLFREPAGFEQVAAGHYLVFDRRGHAVYRVEAGGDTATRLVQIGGEEGRVLEPSAFDAAPDGTFAVADAPNGRERVQVFNARGDLFSTFRLPGRANARVAIGALALNGVGTLAYTGESVVMNQPESGWLITEYGLAGTPVRTVGQLRPTGHEADRELHLALNAGIPVPEPGGGFYLVFLAGPPAFRKYDAKGTLTYERALQGREIDPVVMSQPQRWPRRTVGTTEVPLVAPIVRTAAVDGKGQLWVSFLPPVTYVYDPDGEKIRTVQLRGAGILSPASLSFSSRGRLLVAPGCYEFGPG
jgi:hypothetical protein